MLFSCPPSFLCCGFRAKQEYVGFDADGADAGKNLSSVLPRTVLRLNVLYGIACPLLGYVLGFRMAI